MPDRVQAETAVSPASPLGRGGPLVQRLALSLSQSVPPFATQRPPTSQDASRVAPAKREVERSKNNVVKPTAFEAAQLIKPPALPGVSDFQQRLFEQGLTSEIRQPPTTDDLRRQRHPVPVAEKPVSETIIEDRR